MSKNLLKKVRLILVEPAGSLNVGSIARIMKNMGLTRLVLVNPQCDYNSEEARKMAVHAGDVLEEAKIVPTLLEALQGVNRAIATTARQRSLPTELESPKVALPWLLSNNLETALLFGPEDRGLSNLELNYAHRYICISSNPEYPVLNLAQAVAICAYELYQLTQSNLPYNIDAATDLASLEVVEGYYQHLESILLKIGYLHPHTATARMEKLRRLFNKAQLTAEEVTSLRGILRQIDWDQQQKSDQISQQ